MNVKELKAVLENVDENKEVCFTFHDGNATVISGCGVSEETILTDKIEPNHKKFDWDVEEVDKADFQEQEVVLFQ